MRNLATGCYRKPVYTAVYGHHIQILNDMSADNRAVLFTTLATVFYDPGGRP